MRTLIAALLLISLLAACSQRPEVGPAAPADSQSTAQNLQGFQLDLVVQPPSESRDLGLNLQDLGSQDLDTLATTQPLDKSGPLAKLSRPLVQELAALESGLSTQGAAAESIVIDALASADPQTLLEDLRGLGLENGAVAGGLVSGRLPVTALAQAAELDSLKTMRPTVAVTRVGKVTGEARRALAADVASQTAGVIGEGQTVGILSDSFDLIKVSECGPGTSDVISYADDIETGDLPEGVNILEDGPLERCDPDPAVVDELSDEGRAMAQLIYDVAPGVDLAFHTGFAGEASFAEGILELAETGSSVIVDDVGILSEPFFQDGIIAQAADTVAQRGVPYFSSAGNRANASYESPFRDAGEDLVFDFDGDGEPDNLGRLHDFSADGAGQVLQTVTLQPGETWLPSFQWDEPFASVSEESPGSSSDLDIFFFIIDEAEQLSFSGVSSEETNIGADPLETTGFINPTNQPLTVGLAITLVEGEAPGLLKYIDFGNATEAFDPPQGAPTTFGHPNARNARAVAAAFWGDTPAFGTTPPIAETFTSLGGIPILFDVAGNRLPQPETRQQPAFTASDGDNTTFFTQDSPLDEDELPNFFGTSASAPNAAAVAALQLSKNPDLKVPQLYSALEDSAIDMNEPGFDFLTGTGLIQADKALSQFFTIETETDLALTRKRGVSRVHLKTNRDRPGIIWEFEGPKVPGLLFAPNGQIIVLDRLAEAGSYMVSAQAKDLGCIARQESPCKVRKTFRLELN